MLKFGKKNIKISKYRTSSIEDDYEVKVYLSERQTLSPVDLSEGAFPACRTPRSIAVSLYVPPCGGHLPWTK